MLLILTTFIAIYYLAAFEWVRLVEWVDRDRAELEDDEEHRIQMKNLLYRVERE